MSGERKLIFTHLELLFVVALWAGTFVSTKIVLGQIPPAVAALYRYGLASFALFLANIRNKEKPKRADYPLVVLLGATGVTLYYLLQHYGIRNTTAMDASLLISLSPAFICILSWIFLRERVKLLTVIGLVVALTGSVLVIMDGRADFGAFGERLAGNILITLTAVSWAVYSIAGKRAMERYKPITIITYSTYIGTLLIIPFAFAEIRSGSKVGLDLTGWLHMLYLGLAASAYGYIAWNRALCKLPAVTVGSYLYFRPVLTGIVALLVLGEKPGLSMAIGGTLIIAGTMLTVRAGRGKALKREKEEQSSRGTKAAKV